MTSFARLAALTVAAVCMHADAVIVIDDFSQSQALIGDGLSDLYGTWSQSPILSPRPLGGYRELFVMKTGGAGTVTAEVAGGVYSLSIPVGTSGVGVLRWDGIASGTETFPGMLGGNHIDPTGLGGIDLLYGNTAFSLSVVSAPAAFALEIQAFTDAVNWTSVTLTVPSGAGLRSVPFTSFYGLDIAYTPGGFGRATTGAGVDFSNLGALQFIVAADLVTTGVSSSMLLAPAALGAPFSVSFGTVSAVPEPNALAMLVLGLLLVGAMRHKGSA